MASLQAIHAIEQRIVQLVATAGRAVEALGADPQPDQDNFELHASRYFELLGEIYMGVREQLKAAHLAAVPHLTSPYAREQELTVAATDVAIARDLVAEAIAAAEEALRPPV